MVCGGINRGVRWRIPTSRRRAVWWKLVKFALLTRDVAPYLVDRYSGRKESAQALAKRVNHRGL